MALIDAFFPGRTSSDRFNDFDEAESGDLGLHFRNEKRRANAMDAKMERILFLLYVLIAVMVGTGTLPLKEMFAHWLGMG